jgi:hypothetical protein
LLRIDYLDRNVINYRDRSQTLAAAYTELGAFEEAVEYQRKAEDLESDHDEKSRKQIRERLRLYRERKPYREEPSNEMD